MVYSLYFIFSLQFKWCLEDTHVKDMFVPKGTCVFINKHWLHWDQELWGPEDINEFVPERLSIYRSIHVLHSHAVHTFNTELP